MVERFIVDFRRLSAARPVLTLALLVLSFAALGSVVALSVASARPGGRQLMVWSISGAVIGAAGVMMWRHFRGAPPFDESLQSTLHLR